MSCRYYHYICDAKQKEDYVQILHGLSEFEPEIPLINQYSLEKANQLFKMVLYDNPRIFYSSPLESMAMEYGKHVAIKPNYFFPERRVLHLMTWIQEKVDEICAPILDLDDPFAQEVYIHDYLISHVQYSHDEVAQPANAYSVAGTLLESFSVCAGIALSFKLLMDHLGIPCIVAHGDIPQEDGPVEHHAWNIVQIEGSFYHVDVTFDLLGEQKEQLICYDFFNVTSEQIYQNRGPAHSYPPCTDSTHNYFFHNQAVVHSFAELKYFLNRGLKKKDQTIYFHYAFPLENPGQVIKRLLPEIAADGTFRFSVKEDARTILILKTS